MARISQYKALGTKLGGYKATLSKVQSQEYAKAHADWKAGEAKSLYGEIGGSVANILGIIDESKKLKAMQPLDTPDRPQLKFNAKERLDTISPDALEDLGGVRTELEEDFGMESDAVAGIDSEAMQIRGPAFDKLGIDIPPKPAVQDYYSGQVGRPGASQYIKLSPDTTAGALSMEGMPFEEGGGRKGAVQTEQGYPMWGEDSVGAGDATYPTKAEVAGIHPVQEQGSLASLANVPSYQATDDEIQAYQNEIDQSIKSNLPLDNPGYPTAEEVEKYQPAPITDDMAFDALTDTTLGDFDASSLPSKLSFASPSEQKLADILKERSGGQYDVTPQMFDKLAKDFGYAETQNKNVRQRQIGEVGDKGTGAGEGIYQYETSKPYFSKKEQKMTKGSGSFQTGLQRVKNLYSEMGKDVPSWVSDVMDKDSPKYDSPLELTPEQQRELLMADLYYKKGSWKTLGESFSKGDFKDAWLDLHWAGAKRGTKEYQEKGAYWDSVMTARRGK